eukprot:1641123-Rhodomonas_salina.2
MCGTGIAHAPAVCTAMSGTDLAAHTTLAPQLFVLRERECTGAVESRWSLLPSRYEDPGTVPDACTRSALLVLECAMPGTGLPYGATDVRYWRRTLSQLRTDLQYGAASADV